VTDKIRGYELHYLPVPHGVTVTCERYTHRGPSLLRESSDVFAASTGFVHLYTLHFKQKRKSAAVLAKATVHQQGMYSRSSWLADFSFQLVSGLYKNFIRMSPSDFYF